MKCIPWLFSMCLLSSVAVSAVPDFASYADVNQKKAAFFDFMYPRILAANKKVMREREIVKQGLPSAELKKICEKYSSDCAATDPARVTRLLERVDVIPPSLVLAQSANESAWGTSRFARDANNFFGQWCFSEGCGLVPSARDPGAKHEVRKFANVQQSVAAYIFNLNTGRVYSSIRKLRAAARAAEKMPNGYELAAGLLKYSQRREKYVKEIKSMISYNKLVQRYDAKFWQEL